MTIALERIAKEEERRTGSLDLSDLGLAELPEALFALQHLRALDLGSSLPWLLPASRIDAQRECLRALPSLEVLAVVQTDLTSLDFARYLPSLQRLNCSFTQITDLTPISGLTALQHLDCSTTQVADLTPLSGLTALQHFDCSNTQITDLMSLSEVIGLQRFNCSFTEVDNLLALFRLAALQSVDCSKTQVSDLKPLSGLNALQDLDCSNTEVAELAHLSGLTALQYLNCSSTSVANLVPLSALTALQHLNCRHTQISNLTPLSGLTSLQHLDCSRTRVAELTPLSGLNSLQKLDCSYTQVADLAPLSELTDLRRLDLSKCSLKNLPPSIVNKRSLQGLYLYGSHVPGMPQAGVLSSFLSDNCLNAVRAHFADLSAGAAEMADVKLLLLGNGSAGKTQIARWLAGQPFQPDWHSTHGIQIGSTDLPGTSGTRLHVWDFGGQDIYHGTHALFLCSPAVLMPIWAEDTERLETHEHDGLTFRNHPLDYWVDIARHQGHPNSPVLIVQSKCDRPDQEVLPFPIRPEALQSLPYRKQLHVSAKANRGWDTFTAALREAVTWLHDPARLGAVQIGAGRLRVQRRLEAMRDADAARPVDQRQHRLLEPDQFEQICTEAGGVSAPAQLLAYLDANGTVFHRPGLFGDRVVLDQAWALEAIYAVFDRKQSFRQIQRADGRFTRALLGLSVWRTYGDDEQKLFLSMMRSCGICFLHRRFGDEPEEDGEYIAPDLLPPRAAIAGRLPGRWDRDSPAETAIFHHALLHGGLIRAVLSEIGEAAGPDALYWQGGVCGYEATTGSRLLIEQEMTGQWQGAIRVQTQHGQAPELLARLTEMVERAQAQLGLQPRSVERSPGPRPAMPAPDPRPLIFAQEKPAEREWYVSYAWNDDLTPEGRDREAVVDALCEAAEQRGRRILREKNQLSPGDSISAFMRRIADGDRVFIVLSDKYLRSPHCMLELCEVWRTSRQEGRAFLDRVRVYALPDAKILDPVDRIDCGIYWKEKLDQLDSRARQHGAAILGEDGQRRLMQMQTFSTQVPDILATIASILLPRTVEELRRYGLDDAQPDGPSSATDAARRT